MARKHDVRPGPGGTVPAPTPRPHFNRTNLPLRFTMFL